MINVQPYIDKLEKLKDYVDIVIDKVENEYWMKQMSKINIGYSGTKYFHNVAVLKVNIYEDSKGWIIPFDEWLKLTNTNV